MALAMVLACSLRKRTRCLSLRNFWVSTAFTNATTKYITNISASLDALMWKVNTGGIKKKFQLRALSTAAISTGQISNNIAKIHTLSKSRSEAVLYSIIDCNNQQPRATHATTVVPVIVGDGDAVIISGFSRLFCTVSVVILVVSSYKCNLFIGLYVPIPTLDVL